MLCTKPVADLTTCCGTRFTSATHVLPLAWAFVTVPVLLDACMHRRTGVSSAGNIGSSEVTGHASHHPCAWLAVMTTLSHNLYHDSATPHCAKCADQTLHHAKHAGDTSSSNQAIRQGDVHRCRLCQGPLCRLSRLQAMQTASLGHVHEEHIFLDRMQACALDVSAEGVPER